MAQAKYKHEEVLTRHYRQLENCGTIKICKKFENKWWIVSE